MFQPIQPQFKIRLYPRDSRPQGNDKFSSKGLRYNADKFASYMDIEECVAYPVVYEETADLINKLTFTVDKHADVLIYRMFLGMWIVLFGGYYDGDGKGVRKVFSGTVTRIYLDCPDNGKIRFRVECMGYSFNQMGKDTYNNFTYPDPNSKRPFAKGRTTITLENLIRGIVEECGMVVGEISLPSAKAGETFTSTHIRYQKNISDWKFLLSLAKSYGCTIWTEVRDGTEYFYFVDINRAANTINDEISFVYPLQGDKLKVENVNASEVQRFSDTRWNRPRIMRSVSVTEDIDQANAVVRSSYDVDMETGDVKMQVSEIGEENGRKVIYMYELDEAKVEYINRTNPELADKIRNSGITDMKWSSGVPIKQESPEYARYYYKQTKIVDAETAVFDRAFFGITVEATVNQDLDIRSQRSYPIRGILRYDTTNHTSRYFLRSLRHVWDSNGTSTELEFIR